MWLRFRLHNLTSFDAPTAATPEVSLQLPSEWARTTLRFTPDEIQTQVLDADADRLLLCCSRQWGKSTVAAAKALHVALTNPGSVILIASASLRQSAELLAKIRAFASAYTNERTGIRLPNQSRILALPQSPNTIRGYAAKLIIIDEAAYVKDDLFNAITPALASTGGALWLLSSANEQRGFFYNTWSRRPEDWRIFKATAADCARIGKEFLERERKLKDEVSFQREYMCEFRAGKLQYIDRALIEQAFNNNYKQLNLKLDYRHGNS
jgi:Terminase large subunit, T4likevirus-type, N-terminal